MVDLTITQIRPLAETVLSQTQTSGLCSPWKADTDHTMTRTLAPLAEAQAKSRWT